MLTFENVIATKRNAILILSISRPKVKNAFSMATYLELTAALNHAAKDDTLSAVILTGTGNYFSSGADLKEGVFSIDDDANDDLPKKMSEKPPGIFMAALLDFPKVLCAAVNGHAVGIAVTLLAHCDLCWCVESATFWAPFSRLALVPEFCSSITFTERMGLSKANELLLLGRKIDASTALDWNICSRIVSSCDANDPLHPNGIASIMCRELEGALLSLPNGGETGRVFVSLMRGERKGYLNKVCKNELEILDQRIADGEVLEAAMQLKFGKSKL